MKVLALSYLFPNQSHRDYGIFVYNRLKAIQQYCAVKVIAPLQRYPFRTLLRPALGNTENIADKGAFGGLETWYPRFLTIPRYLKTLDSISYYFAVLPIVKGLWQESYHFDVIDVHWTYPDILTAYLLSRYYRKPFIVTVRGREALYPNEHGGRKRLLDWCLRRADAVVTLSQELADMVAQCGVKRDKVHVILNGVNTGTFYPLDRFETRTRLGLAQEKMIVVSVGRLTEGKGHQHIIKALSSFSMERELELHIIGGINPESDFSNQLKQQAAALGTVKVHFHSGMVQEQLLYWYNAADLFCLASHGEGCPNVVLEAMACGTPVVVSDVGAVRSIVAVGSDGFIVGDFENLTGTLREALSMCWDRQGIASRMKQKSWDGCAKQVIELYKEVVTHYCQ